MKRLRLELYAKWGASLVTTIITVVVLLSFRVHVMAVFVIGVALFVGLMYFLHPESAQEMTQKERQLKKEDMLDRVQQIAQALDDAAKQVSQHNVRDVRDQLEQIGGLLMEVVEKLRQTETQASTVQSLTFVAEDTLTIVERYIVVAKGGTRESASLLAQIRESVLPQVESRLKAFLSRLQRESEVALTIDVQVLTETLDTMGYKKE